MQRFDELVDQERSVRLIKASLANGHIPYAFLFTGLNGVGKKTAALSFAMAANCHANRQEAGGSGRINREQPFSKAFCGSCRSCKKIISGTHPDIHIVKPAGTVIKVEQIRGLCRKLVVKPNEAYLRLALIEDAHLLNPEAGNTLLKTLEEPPDHTVFILTAIEASDILPTIVSRCRHIRFNPISIRHLASMLAKKYELDEIKAHMLAAMSGGSFTAAAIMAESDWITRRNLLIERIEFLSRNSIRFALAFSEALSKNKKWLSDTLFIMKTWYRDLMIFHFSPGHIVNRDLIEKIRKTSFQTTIEKIILKIRAIEEAEQNVTANTNIRSTLDALVITLFGEK